MGYLRVGGRGRSASRAEEVGRGMSRSVEGIRQRGDIYIAGGSVGGAAEGRGGRDRGCSGGSDEGHICHILLQGRFGAGGRSGAVGVGWTGLGGSGGFLLWGPRDEVGHCPGHCSLEIQWGAPGRWGWRSSDLFRRRVVGGKERGERRSKQSRAWPHILNDWSAGSRYHIRGPG